MHGLMDEVRTALIVLAVVLAPYLCYRASGALEHEQVISASRVTGWVELTPQMKRQGTVAASSQNGRR
ncbi:MAG TPA: hypothetical protein VHC22_02620 [Pirellulales bacterium]|nr:hypothetical protein [Pirellulales bacterium]